MSLSPTLIHAGTEVVVVGAIAFYFYRKTSSLEERVSVLEKKLEMYEKVLQGHEHFIRNMIRPGSTSAPPPPPPTIPAPVQEVVQPKEDPDELDSLLKNALEENNGTNTD